MYNSLCRGRFLQPKHTSDAGVIKTLVGSKHASICNECTCVCPTSCFDHLSCHLSRWHPLTMSNNATC